MTPHPTDTSEITEPMDLRATVPLHPRDALCLRMLRERDGVIALHEAADNDAARSEYYEYSLLIEAVMGRIDHWEAWHAGEEESTNG